VAEESFDSLNRRTANQLAQDGSFDSLKREIHQTRVEMSHTIGEIQDRLRPDHLLQEAKHSVKEAAAGKARSIMNSAGETAATVAYKARGAGEYLADYANQHPIRIAVTIGALTWFMLRGRNRPTDWYGAEDTSWQGDGDSAFAYDDGNQPLRAKVGDYASSARETVGQYASSAKETVGQYASSAKETVGQYASSAKETAGEYAESARLAALRASERARTAASSATSSVDQFARENPLAAGAIALAVGAAIGLSMPRTEIEDRAMGETRDQAWQRASRVARDLTDNVAQRVQAVAEDVVGESLAASKTGSVGPNMGRA
jgi:ElaB/YqjD/DUF883 family membrane-anchored ribosome-binding protein